MATDTPARYRTKRVPFRRADGRLAGYVRVPDKADPAYQVYLDEHYARLDATLDQAAKELCITRKELVERLSGD